MADASARDYKEALVEALSVFECYPDHDVQDFLNTKAISFEKRGWASTYLLLNEEALLSGEIKIEGYFSLTHKAVFFDTEVSRSTRNKITGAKEAETHSFVLIGQLGKSIVHNEDGSTTPSPITSKNLLDDAFNIIRQSSEYIICRNVIVECKSIEKIQKIYSDYGFNELQFDGELHTMYLKIDNSIDF